MQLEDWTNTVRITFIVQLKQNGNQNLYGGPKINIHQGWNVVALDGKLKVIIQNEQPVSNYSDSNYGLILVCKLKRSSLPESII